MLRGEVGILFLDSIFLVTKRFYRSRPTSLEGPVMMCQEVFVKDTTKHYINLYPLLSTDGEIEGS